MKLSFQYICVAIQTPHVVSQGKTILLTVKIVQKSLRRTDLGKHESTSVVVISGWIVADRFPDLF